MKPLVPSSQMETCPSSPESIPLHTLGWVTHSRAGVAVSYFSMDSLKIKCYPVICPIGIHLGPWIRIDILLLRMHNTEQHLI